MRWASMAALLSTLVLARCTCLVGSFAYADAADLPGEAGAGDLASRDLGATDLGAADAEAGDSGRADHLLPDLGEDDASAVDASEPDRVRLDSARFDVAAADASAPDAEADDGAAIDIATVDAPGDAAATDSAVVLEDAGADAGFDASACLVRIPPPGAAGVSAFGVSVATYGDVAVVGAHTTTTGVNGSVFVLSRNLEGVWQLDEQLSPDDGSSDDGFGRSVAILADLIAVGAPADSSSADQAGAAHVFQRGAGATGTWSHEKRIELVDTAVADDRFGSAVVLMTDTLMVGAPGRDLELGDDGAVHLFRHHQPTSNAWGPAGVRAATEPQHSYQLGASLAVSGSRLLIGGVGDSQWGLALIEERDLPLPHTWGRSTEVVPWDIDGSEDFGVATALWQYYAAVGCPGAVAAGVRSGAVLVYLLDNPYWLEHTSMLPTSPRQDGRFGTAIAFAYDRLFVAEASWSPSTGLAGRLSWFVLVASSLWLPEGSLLAPGGEPSFGFALAAAGEQLLIGAPGDGGGSGALYVLELTPDCLAP